MDIKKIIKQYNDKSGSKINIHEDLDILAKINLIMDKINLQSDELINLLQTLQLLKKTKLIENVNDESLYLLSRICGNVSGFSKEDSSYFCIRLKYLLLPYKMNNFSKEDMMKNLMEFDIMINNIVLELNDMELLIIKKYNEELYNVIMIYKNICNKYQEKCTIDNSSIVDNIIIDTTLSHLVTMFYLCLNMYDYQYDLLEKAFDSIINNYQEYLYRCRVYDIFSDKINLVFNPTNIYNEYAICKEILDKQFIPAVRIIRQ